MKMDKHARYRFKNRLELAAKEALRRAGPAAPKWLTQEHHDTIFRIYIEAEQRSVWTGMPFQVDHIVPLQGICTRTGRHIVCGLHVPWNLRPIPEVVNKAKKDAFESDWPATNDDQWDDTDWDEEIPF